MTALCTCHGGVILGFRHAVSDAAWERVRHLPPGQPGRHGGTAEDNRRFLGAVLWTARTGAAWPARAVGPLEQPAAAVRPVGQGGAVRRPGGGVPRPRPGPPAAGRDGGAGAPVRGRGEKKWDGSGGQPEQALGRSRGGFGTKRHGGFNGLGQPVELTATPGQASDIGQAEGLLADHRPEAVIADKAYDKKAFVEEIESRGAEAVIPTQVNRAEQREVDRHLSKERNVCERFWAQAKQYRRVATRYEKTAANFLAFAWVAALTVMLKCPARRPPVHTA